MPRIYLISVAALAFAACQPQGESKQDAAPAAKVAAASAQAPAPDASRYSPVADKPGPCMMQDGKPLSVKPLSALGTEPFWGAKIEGRCVTYSSPENQTGTRIWTRYTATADGGRWSGSLDVKKFELVTRNAPNCSDGMSETKFPIAVDLMVNGEQQKGCAKP